jgi:hypothetical protein
MVLMLASAARQSKETLRFFRDRAMCWASCRGRTTSIATWLC